MFLKIKLDKLALYRKYNYKIELIEEYNLGYLLLQKYTKEEL